MKDRRLLCAVSGCLLAFCLGGRAQENGDWRAASSNAKSITGDVAFAGERFSLNFSTYPAAEIRALKPEEMSAVFDVPADEGGRGNLYRVSIPAGKKFLHKNTLCGSEDTQWVATYVAGRNLQLAFFSGASMPVLTVDALSNATDLCGLFSYSR
jgi:hypothetical protein